MDFFEVLAQFFPRRLGIFHFGLLLLLVGSVEAKITCRGLNGEPVDWFVVYKPPTTSKSTAKFYYMDAAHSSWTLAPLTMDSASTAVGATLRDFYGQNQRHFSFAYNDDSPTGKVDSYRGHSKGVVLFDEETGFWIIHSVPNFPPLGRYGYPATGLKFGQTFLCLTLSSQFLGDVGEHLRYVQATPFFSNLPESFSMSATKEEKKRKKTQNFSIPVTSHSYRFSFFFRKK
ncbi:hypothetical protein RB195_004107 [Necator americanus]|uniref:Uncharacterized protein n=1 Tax=Necator americanus TaxID=51031 RepID=A0ABR1BJX5_NECAM